MTFLKFAVVLSLSVAPVFGFGFSPAQAPEGTVAPQVRGEQDDELLRKIRRQISSDDSLSMEAHNVHLAVKDGLVTLQGKVKSQEEKAKVEAHAKNLAGSDKVTNQIIVNF